MILLLVFQRLLEKQGFQISGFTEPLLALEHFQQNFTNYRLVISDINISRMDGYEFVKKVKEIKPEVKVFFMTAYEIDDTNFSSIKIDEIITKPISCSVLGNLEYNKEVY
ncbi:MAG: response regulator [Candidatus Nitrosopolaris sp.]